MGDDDQSGLAEDHRGVDGSLLFLAAPSAIMTPPIERPAITTRRPVRTAQRKLGGASRDLSAHTASTTIASTMRPTATCIPIHTA